MKCHRVSSPAAKTDRNAKIRSRSKRGETVADLARAYGLSRIRIQQILEAQYVVSQPTLDLGPNTPLATLPISARLKKACDLLAINSVAELAVSVSKLRRLDNIGNRTALEAIEVLSEAGMGVQLLAPPLQSIEERQAKHNKRRMLRETRSSTCTSAIGRPKID